jgi:hypothetical protein
MDPEPDVTRAKFVEAVRKRDEKVLNGPRSVV